MSIDEKAFDDALRDAAFLSRAKDKPPRPTKYDIKRRFRLEVVRGKPRMVEVK